MIRVVGNDDKHYLKNLMRVLSRALVTHCKTVIRFDVETDYPADGPASAHITVQLIDTQPHKWSAPKRRAKAKKRSVR